MTMGRHQVTSRPRPAVPARVDSFEEFVEATGTQLFRTALLLSGEHHAAEDLVQATYAKVFASWRRVRRSDNPVAYCRTILAHTYVSERRLRRSSERPGGVLDPDATRPGPETDLAERVDLLGALARLDPDDRAVLVLRFYEDLSVSQTADLLRLREAAVRKRSQRALARLRLLLPDLTDASPEGDR